MKVDSFAYIKIKNFCFEVLEKKKVRKQVKNEISIMRLVLD